MMRYLLSFGLLFTAVTTSAQELFPHTEPASNIPKGVLGIRVSSEAYKEVDQLRLWQGYRFMYGLTPKLQLTQLFNFSNHHGKKLPDDFISHDGNIGPHTHGSDKGNKYPFAFENLCLTLKYRFLSLDKEHSHFRMAAYAEAAGGNSAHDESEPSLMGDNSGLAGGTVATLLLHKLAISFTGGAILPHKYNQRDSNIVIDFGPAFNYSLSMGYLLYPREYKSYDQTNINLYTEFIGKTYNSVDITKDGQAVKLADAPGLEAGSYVEVRPALQFIIRSNTRIDLSVSQPLIGRSHVKTYPVFYLNLQHYFFFK